MSFLVFYLVFLVFFATMKTLILGDTLVVYEFPIFVEPQVSFDFSPDFVKVGGADFIADAISNIGELFKLFFINIVAALNLVFNGIGYVIAWAVFLISVSFTFTPGTPALVNVLLSTPLVIASAVLFFNLVTKRKPDV